MQPSAGVGLPSAVQAAAHGFDQRRADHDAVGALRDRARLLRRAHAEADADRQFGMALDARDRGCDLARVRRGGAGNAGDRDVIDKARSVREHSRQPLVVGRRRGEADEIEAGLQRRQAKFGVLLGRQIDDDQPVDAGGFGVRQKFFHAVDVDRIVVAHQHDRRRVVAARGIRAPAQASASCSARTRARAGPPPGSPARPPSDR